MKAKFNYIIVFVLVSVALIINATLFYIPQIKGDYSISYTPDERIQVYLKGGDYLEIFSGHDFWKSTENEYHPSIKGQPQKENTYKEDWLTKQKNEILEIVENEDIRVETKLTSTNSKNFELQRKYTIKNEYLLEDIDTSYMQLIIASDFYSYSKEESRLNFTQCKLVIDKPNHLELKYDYGNSFLGISRIIHEEMKGNNTYTINLNFNIDCE
jgi:hypothetical protein